MSRRIRSCLRASRGERGLSLVEAVLALAVVAALIVAAGNAAISGTRNLARLEERFLMQGLASALVDAAGRESYDAMRKGAPDLWVTRVLGAVPEGFEVEAHTRPGTTRNTLRMLISVRSTRAGHIPPIETERVLVRPGASLWLPLSGPADAI